MDGKLTRVRKSLEGPRVYLFHGNSRERVLLVDVGLGLSFRENARQIPPDRSKFIWDHLELLPPQVLWFEAKVGGNLLDGVE